MPAGKHDDNQTVKMIKQRMRTNLGIDLDFYTVDVLDWPWNNGFRFKCRDRAKLFALYDECKKKMAQIWWVEEAKEVLTNVFSEKQCWTSMDSAFRENSPNGSIHISLYFARDDRDGGIHVDHVSIVEGRDADGKANYAAKPWLSHIAEDLLRLK